MIQGKSLTLKVFTPNGLIHEFKELFSINVPLANGYPLGIMSGHAPLIAGTAQGMIRYRSNDHNGELKFHAGILSIRDNMVIIFTAGELGASEKVQISPEETKYNRLMETLVNKLKMGEEQPTP
jgi:F0F1-type ATP synthase epsilon subunit